jgi:signal transduction histidine kinase
MRSLRFRLLAIVGFVSVVAVVTVVLVSREGVRTEFRRFESKTRAYAVEDAAGAIQTWVDAGGDPLESGEVLRRFDRPGQDALILLDSTGSVLSVSNPKLGDLELQLDQVRGRLDILHARLDGPRRTVKRMQFRGAPRESIIGRDGRPRAFVVGVPAFEFQEGPAAPYVRSVNRWMVGAVGAAAILAMLVTWLLSRRIVGPVEALTGAVQRMERGDWNARVAVRSRDEIGDLSHAFNAMADALGRNEALRRQLVSDVAHELRTPLTNLRAQLEAIEDGIVPGDEAALRSLHEETLLLTRLVEDLQELSIAEAGRLRLDRMDVSPLEALAAAATAFRAQADASGITLEVVPAAAGLPAVSADPARLAQILRNLLANALTHTPRGGRVTLRAEHDAGEPDGGGGGSGGGGGGARGAIRFEVRDTGEGIAAEHLPRLFDRFYRADPSRSRDTGGAGLGLSIVRHLVEAHGGSIVVTSEAAHGTSVSFTIPTAARAG